MKFVFVGLGNPGIEYEKTRHNVGRIVLESFRKQFDFPEFVLSAKYAGLISVGKIKSHSVSILLPETFMNKSGSSVSKLVTSKKQAETMVVVHDDLDLPIGTYKLSWNRGSGGHRGVESIVRALKTETFLRIRIGISPSTPKGKIKKPKGESAVEKLILGKFNSTEFANLQKLAKRIGATLESFVLVGKDKTMSIKF